MLDAFLRDDFSHCPTSRTGMSHFDLMNPATDLHQTSKQSYPLVNSHITMENQNFLIGKSTINGPCLIAMLNYQRVCQKSGLEEYNPER